MNLLTSSQHDHAIHNDMTSYSYLFSKWWHLNKKILSSSALIFLGSIYVLSEVYYLFTRFDLHLADLTLYYETAGRIMMGQVPYRDFQMDYPFFSIIPILLPGLLNMLFGSTFEFYCVLFALQNLLFAAATAIFLAKTKIEGQHIKSRIKFYVLLILISLPVYLFRYDAFPAFLTGIIVFGIRKNAFLSGMAWVIATGSKLYPLVLGPVLLVYYLINKNFKRLFAGLLGVGVTLLCTLIFTLPVIGTSVFDVVSRHKLRGIQIESVTGGFLLILAKLKLLIVTPVFNFGSVNIDTPSSGIILSWTMFISPIVFLLLLCHFVIILLSEKRRTGEISQIHIIRSFGIMILAFLLLNKVLSPQYLIWLFPLVPFYSTSIQHKFVVALILTISIFPGWYSYLVNLNPIIILVLNIRNALLIWILIDLIRQMNDSRKLASLRII